MGVVLSVVVSLTSVCISDTMGRLTGWRWTWWVWCYLLLFLFSLYKRHNGTFDWVKVNVMGVVLSVVVSLTSVCISDTMGRLTGWRWTWWAWCQTKASTSRWRGISNRTMTTSSGWTSRQTSTQSTCLLRRVWQPAGCTSHVQVSTDLLGGFKIYVFVCVCVHACVGVCTCMCGCMHACVCVCV